MFFINFLDYVVRRLLGLFLRLTAYPSERLYNNILFRDSDVVSHLKRIFFMAVFPDRPDVVRLPPMSIFFATYFVLKKKIIKFVYQTFANTKLKQIALAKLLASSARVAFVLLLVYIVVAYVHLSWQTVPFAKVLFAWLSIGAFFYLLISGFVYFTNKLTYSSNVDVMQRFWKRTFSIFWLIEGGLFAFFVYMTINASSEVWAGYDTPSLFKTQFFSLKMLFVRLCLLSMCILFTSLLVGTVQRQNSYNEALTQFFITSLIVMSLWIESYQFYLFVLCAPSYGWVFNSEIHETVIEPDMRRNRLLRNFVFICAMAKFWHFIFIATNWFFYLNRQLEHPEVRAGLLNSVIQNLLILYVLNLITVFPYVKHLVHRGLAKPYFWFLIEEGTAILPQFTELVYNIYTGLII